MNKLHRIFIVLAVAAAAVSCARETLAPEQKILGEFVLDDGSGLADGYLSFQKGGKMIEYKSSGVDYTFAENSFWHCSDTDFEENSTASYYIQDGVLYLNDQTYSSIELNDGILAIGERKYSQLKSFKSEYYSSIKVQESITVHYTGSSQTIDVAVVNPIASGKLTAQSETDWLSNVAVSETDGILTFDVADSNEDRTGEIVVNYTNAEPVTLIVNQKPSIFIELPATTGTTDYTAKDVSFSYSIQNPISSSSLSVKCDVSWVTDINVSDNAVSFKVSENATYNWRTARFTLVYRGAADVTCVFEQSGLPIQSLSINTSSLNLYVDEMSTLTATVVPTDSPLIWSSSDKNVVTVDNVGNVKAIGRGDATITVSSGDKKAECTVAVARLTPTFSISSNTLFCGVDGSAVISINSDSDCIFTASSDNTSIAGVTVNGKTVTVSGKAVGTANITVNCPETSKYSAEISLCCSVTVKEISGTDLSYNGTANCYIVSKAGNYKFKATVKGSSTESVGTPTQAVVLWESFGTSTAPSVGDLVNSVIYSGGYVSFNATSQKGNAVIAVRNSSGAILWSWHIWLTYSPSSQVYNNSAGTMMDRNLGATSATPGDVRALGLLYQWGRKDPFLGSSSISNSTIAASTLSWPSTVSSDSSNGTIAYAVAHPTTFITCNYSNYDWYYTGLSSTDNTRWRTSSSDKGIYDPCPPGWRVPDGGSSGVWSTAFGSSSSYSSGPWDSTNKGMDFGSGNGKSSPMQFGSSSTIWYPASGYRGYGDGSLSSVGYSGSYWSCTPYSCYAYYLYFYNIGDVSPSNSSVRAYGQGVRCIKE